MRARWQIPCAALCLVLLGCGDPKDETAPTNDGGADAAEALPIKQCPSAPACGGDLQGTWNVTSTCLDVDLSSYTRDCPSSTAHTKDYAISGTLTYAADQTYSLETTLTGSVVVDLPAICLTPPNGVQITCDQLEPALLATGRFQFVSCLLRGGDGGGCVCSLGVNPRTWYSNGTYVTTESGQLTQTDSTGAVDRVDYCVTDGATMALAPPPGSAMLAQQGVSGTLTLTKQTR